MTVKRFVLLLPAAALLAGCGKASLKTADQKMSYSYGFDYGNRLVQQKMVAIDPAAALAGMRDALAKAPPQITPEESHRLLSARRNEAEAKKSQEDQADAAKNLTDSEAFLAANKAKDGVKTTESGLQYRVLKEGAGKKPADASQVVLRFTGTLPNGARVIDRMQENAAPMAVAGIFPAWGEGLKLMREGGVYEFYVPPALAYADKGKPGLVPPNTVFILHVELVKVQ